MTDNYIRLKDLRDEIGITVKGMDNALKRIEIKKHYPFQKNIPYILKSDADLIKKHIAANGRVNSIIEKDRKELCIKEEKEKLEEEYKKILHELSLIKESLANSEDKVRILSEDKLIYQEQIHKLSEQSIEYQERLKEANKLLLLEKAESEKFKSLYIENKNLFLQEKKDKEKYIDENEITLAILKSKLNDQENINYELNEKIKELENKGLLSTLVSNIKNKIFNKK